MDGGGDLRDLEDALAPLGDGADDVELVVDLMEDADVLPQHVPVDLSGDEQDGRGGGVGGAQAGGCVEQAGTGDDEGRANVAGRPGVAVRHVGGGGLVACGDEADGGLVIQGVGGVVRLHAGEAEDHADAFSVEGLDQGLAAGHLCHRVHSFGHCGRGSLRLAGPVYHLGGSACRLEERGCDHARAEWERGCEPSCHGRRKTARCVRPDETRRMACCVPEYEGLSRA